MTDPTPLPPPVLGRALTPDEIQAWRDQPAEQAADSLLQLLADLANGNPDDRHAARVAIAEHAVRLAAAIDPATLRTSSDRRARRLAHALTPAANLYADLVSLRPREADRG